MRVYIRCDKLEDQNELYLYNEQDELFYVIRKKQDGFFKALEILDENYNLVYHLNINPLRWNRKYMVNNINNEPVIQISTGFRILHRIRMNNKKYVCKGNMFKMRYRLYDGDKVIVRFKQVKKQHVNFFEMDLAEGEPIDAALAVYIAAMAQRFSCRRKDVES